MFLKFSAKQWEPIEEEEVVEYEGEFGGEKECMEVFRERVDDENESSEGASLSQYL